MGLCDHLPIGAGVVSNCVSISNDIRVQWRARRITKPATTGTFYLTLFAVAVATFLILPPASAAADKTELPTEIVSIMEAAEAGDADAMVSLGGIFSQGKDVEIDLDEAVHWYEMAAKQDNLIGLFSLGLTLDRRRAVGDLEKTVEVFQRGFDIVAASHGPDHQFAGAFLTGLGSALGSLNRFDDALDAYDRARDIFSASGDADTLAIVKNDSAIIYAKMGRHEEAVAAFEFVALHYELNEGPDSKNLADILLNVAASLQNLSRYDEAINAYSRSLEIYGKTQPRPHESIGDLFRNLGRLYWKRRGEDAYNEATGAYFKAWDHYGKVFGEDHESLARIMYQIGDINFELGRYKQAVGNYQDGLRTFDKIYGPDSIRSAGALANIALSRFLAGNVEQALGEYRRATGILIADFNRRGERATGTAALGIDPIRESRSTFKGLVEAAATIAGGNPDADSIEETYAAAQWSSRTTAAAALAQMSARFGAGDSELASLVRERQDRIAQWSQADNRLIRARNHEAQNGDSELIDELSRKREAINNLITEIDTELQKTYPEFSELARPAPLTVAETQALLKPGEALVKFLVAPAQTDIWLVTNDHVRWVTKKIGEDDISKMVSELRVGLDRYGSDTRGANAIDRDNRPGQGLRFDLHLAHKLYDVLLGEFNATLAGIDHLVMVMNGPLQSLPPAILVSSKPAPRYGNYDELSTVDWLIRRHALTVLPAVSSLRALRRVQTTEATDRSPFVGFGDPVLTGAADASDETHSVSPNPALAALFRGALADVDQVRKLAPLPETKYELQTIAGLLGANADSLFLGEQANEAALKGLALENSRILAFATHGLVAGDIEGLTEPALVMTPPDVPSDENDGLLTASEIAQLKLNADWVLLSACNTASGDGTPGAEGLSGLARAFFYAGTRSILVSHWPVQSDAAVELTTGAFAARDRDETIGRAEALRRSILAFIDNPDRPENAHPERWAPFILVGEGLL